MNFRIVFCFTTSRHYVVKICSVYILREISLAIYSGESQFKRNRILNS